MHTRQSIERYRPMETTTWTIDA